MLKRNVSTITATYAGPSDLKRGAQYRMNPAEFTMAKQPLVHFCNLCFPEYIFIIYYFSKLIPVPVVSLLQDGTKS